MFSPPLIETPFCPFTGTCRIPRCVTRKMQRLKNHGFRRCRGHGERNGSYAKTLIHLRSSPAQRSSGCRSNFRCAAIRFGYRPLSQTWSDRRLVRLATIRPSEPRSRSTSQPRFSFMANRLQRLPRLSIHLSLAVVDNRALTAALILDSMVLA